MPSAKRPSRKPSTSKAPTETSARATKGQLHPRNRHQGRYDFAALLHSSPELGEFVILNPYGKQSIDFANPDAVKVFNRALLKQLYGIDHWDIPPGYLCPPIPGRADYVHGLADLLASDNQGQIPRGKQLRVLDVGVGANCIYPLLGHSDYGWQFVGSDIDPTALAAAQVIIDANRLNGAITLRQQNAAQHIFHGLLASDERFDLSLCNPPFHASAAEAASGSQRKWRNLGKLDPQRKLPKLNFGGHSNELWCAGGELAFVQRMAAESREVAEQVLWFSCLVSKASNLPALEGALRKAGACDVRLQSMAQGNKQSRFLAWTYLNPSQQQAWRNARWAVNATR